MLSSRIYRGWNELTGLAAQWDQILRSCDTGIRGLDATCSSVWARVLASTHLRDAQVQALLVASDSQAAAIVPAFTVTQPAGIFPRRELRMINEMYAGRSGLLATNDDPELVQFALQSLAAPPADWDVFVLKIVENSASHTSLTRVAQNLPLRIRCLAVSESPYIELASNWEEVFSALPKKMRWTIRKAEKDLRSKGQIDYEEIVEPAAAASLMTDILEVEKNSWKEQSGTSIAAQGAQQEFYESFVEVAAQKGILSAHLLKLEGRPIAYILGVAAGDGVFLDLKESFDASYSEYSPGHVLKRFAIEALIARGVRTYDFMGNCEPYKMKWTDKTYRRLSIAVFRNTFRGSLCYLRSVLGKNSTAMPPLTSAQPQERVTATR